MHQSFRAALGAVAVLALTATALADAVDIDNVIAKPDQFDKQKITITGTVKMPATRNARNGDKITTFDLCHTQCVHVFAMGDQTAIAADGKTVTVTGDFTASRTFGQRTITNTVRADSVTAGTGSSGSGS